ncbi:MAG: hypothetical protein V4590_06495 [Bacteroidota bacterium]
MKTGNDDSSANRMSIDETTRENIQKYVDQGESAIDRRIRELDNKWDMERTLRLNISILALAGVLFGTYKKNRWSVLSIAVTAFVAQQLISKWYPTRSLLKKLGLQTHREIEHEKYALKALRGDFKSIQNNVDKAWEAVNKEKDRKTIGFMKDRKYNEE